MKEFLDHFAAILGATTVALLLFSVSHEYGYFWIVGSSFQTFASTTDYFANATQWIPYTVTAVYFWLDWGAVTGKKPYSAPLGRDWRTWIFPGIAFGLLVLWFFVGGRVVAYFFIAPLLYVWLVYGVRKLPFKDKPEPIFQHARTALTAIPVVAGVAFAIGMERGAWALEATANPYSISMKGGERRNRVILRNFDKGLLVRSPADQRIEFIRWDQVDEVSRFSPKLSDLPAICSWFGRNCPTEPLSP